MQRSKRNRFGRWEQRPGHFHISPPATPKSAPGESESKRLRYRLRYVEIKTPKGLPSFIREFEDGTFCAVYWCGEKERWFNTFDGAHRWLMSVIRKNAGRVYEWQPRR